MAKKKKKKKKKLFQELDLMLAGVGKREIGN